VRSSFAFQAENAGCPDQHLQKATDSGVKTIAHSCTMLSRLVSRKPAKASALWPTRKKLLQRDRREHRGIIVRRVEMTMQCTQRRGIAIKVGSNAHRAPRCSRQRTNRVKIRDLTLRRLSNALTQRPARRASRSFNLIRKVLVDLNKQIAALTASELQTAGASQATAIAVSVLLRHLRSPELAKLLSSAFENHQAVMLQTPWPDQMLQAFESTRRFLEGAAQADLPGTQAPPETPVA